MTGASATAPSAQDDRPTPANGAGVVSRRALIDRARASGWRLVAVTAPAGFGKSTLLTQWSKLEDRPVALVSLARFDDEPSHLVTLLASACVQVPGVDPDLVADVSGPGVSVLGRAATRLATALRTATMPFVLMLDDVHELRVPECHDIIGLITRAIPDRSQLVMASRAVQPQLPRLQAAGQAIEFGVSDLAMSPADAQAIFAAHDLRLGGAQAADLIRRVEGWPVGIRLAALAAERTGDAVEIAGDTPLVADYLYQEALAPLPAEVVAFLRRSSILDELSGPLCDGVLQRSASEQTLAMIERSRLFIVPIDGRRGWYRYHALFREFLTSELERVEPDLVHMLHRRAADWYESHDAPDRAVEHLLRTPDRRRAAELMSSMALTMYQTGRVSTLARWLAELGDQALLAYPPLAVLACDVDVLIGRTEEAERRLTVVDGLSFAGVPNDGTASFESSRAILRAMMCRDGPERMLADARLAVDLEPATSLWRDGALDMYAQALLLVGDDEQARAVFEETSAVAAACSSTDNYAIAEAQLAVMDLEGGAIDTAAEHAARALAAIEGYRMDDYAIAALVFASGARVAHRQRDDARTRVLLTKAMRARQFCTLTLPYFAVRARLYMARIALAMSDPSSARHLLHEIGDIVRRRPQLGTLIDQVQTLRDELASVTLGPAAVAPLTPAELRVLPYLQTHLTMPEIADRLYVSRNTVRSQVAAIYRKLDVRTRSEAVEAAERAGFLG